MSPNKDKVKDSFQVRVKAAFKGIYQPSMRRSLQSVALFEADRCLEFRYPQLRPFQKKWAVFATAVELLKSLDFLNYYQRCEIMFRTNASKEPLAPDLAWRRMKIITREINSTILPKAKELLENEDNKDKSHDEICDMILQSMYEENNKDSKPRPPQWEFNHNNVFSVYRIYYRGLVADPKMYAATPPKVVQVPMRKPTAGQAPNIVGGLGEGASLSLANMDVLSDEERRAMLKEVKDHTELLRDFEGVIPDEELLQRKRALYAALPPIPPPARGSVWAQKKKKAKVSSGVPPAIPPLKPTAMEKGDLVKEDAPVESLVAV